MSDFLVTAIEDYKPLVLWCPAPWEVNDPECTNILTSFLQAHPIKPIIPNTQALLEYVVHAPKVHWVIYLYSLTHLYRGERMLDMIRNLVLPNNCSYVGFSGETIWQLLDAYGEENRAYCYQAARHKGVKVGRPKTTITITKAQLELALSKYGTLSNAARHLGVSYWSAWRRAKECEISLGPDAATIKHQEATQEKAQRLARAEEARKRVEAAKIALQSSPSDGSLDLTAL